MARTPAIPETLLGDLDAATFLRDYWQQRPLLIRGALPGFRSPVSPEELAGLALQEDVESRLIRELDGPPWWSLEHGPFPEDRFADLPPTHWTLLVQGANRHVPELADLLESFRFIPDWRVDDIMVSYAPEGGSVGPHTDQYDVFLLQGQGRRRWSIGDAPCGDDDLLPDIPLRILRDFDPDHVWVLEPGDMLYLPPGIPHHGEALEPCQTLSVGFRAPGHADLVTAFLEEVAERLPAEGRFADPGRAEPENPGALDTASRARVRDTLRRALDEDAVLDAFFGRFVTTPDHDQDLRPEPPLSESAIRSRIEADEPVWRSEFSRFAFYEEDSGARLFVDGHEHWLGGVLAPAAAFLCRHRRYPAAELAEWLEVDGFPALLTELVNAGALYFPEEA